MVIVSRQSRHHGKLPVLHGRERELAEISELVGAAVAGHGSLVLVSGEAGIGKTALTNDLIYQAEQRGFLVLTGSCYDLTTTSPYGPWLEAIHSYEPSDDAPLPPARVGNPEKLEQVTNQTQLLEETHCFFTCVARDQPLVITLEDMHWSDPASLDLLRYLGRQIGDSRLLIVATYRDDELPRDHRLFQLLPTLIRESPVVRIPVPRLDQSALRVLIARRYALPADDLARLTARIYQQSDGNPFYAIELLHTFGEAGIIRADSDTFDVSSLDAVEIPPLIQQVIERRLSRFSQDQRRLLEAAAVIGHTVSFDLWLTVTGHDVSDLDDLAMEAVAAHVLEHSLNGTDFRFVHALIREVLYSGANAVKRRTLHQQIGEELAHRPQPNPSTVADHLVRAGDERAYEWLIRASTQAERAWVWGQARDYLDDAMVRLTDDHPRRTDRGWLLYRLGNLVRYMDSMQSVEYHNAALTEARSQNDPVLEAYSLAARGGAYCIATHFRHGLEDFRAAGRLFDSVQSLPPEVAGEVDPTEGTPEHRLAGWMTLVGPFDEAAQLLEQLEPLAPQDMSHERLRIASVLGNVAGARAIADQRTEFHAGAHLVPSLSINLSEIFYLVWPYEMDRLDKRERLMREYRAIMEPASMVWFDLRTPAPRRMAWNLFQFIDGDWNSRPIAEFTTERFGSWANDFWKLITCEIAYHQGDTAKAQAVIEHMLPIGPATPPGNNVLPAAQAIQRIAAQMSIRDGDLEGARRWITAHREWLKWSGAKIWWSEDHLLRARYHRASGDLVTARTHARRAYEHACHPRQPLALIAAERFLGQLDVDAERFDEAQGWLHASLGLAERCAAPFEQALTFVVMTERAAKLGEVDEAQQLFFRVREICEPLGAKPTLDCIDEIEAIVPKNARSARLYPAGLTQREVDVLRLVAQGKTDAEAAEELFISPRTASQHLRNVYNKLGVNKRAAAASWATEHNLVG